MSGEKKAQSLGELISFKVVEKEIEVEVPKYVEKVVEVPIYEEKVYEVPVIVYKNVEYEKPTLRMNDITADLKEYVKEEVSKALVEVFAGLKVAFEIPMARILQVRPGGQVGEVVRIRTSMED